jgi:hypothetical protein
MNAMFLVFRFCVVSEEKLRKVILSNMYKKPLKEEYLTKWDALVILLYECNLKTKFGLGLLYERKSLGFYMRERELRL